jgi:hypothetical protein
MMEVGREHVAVDDLRSSSKERDDEKIPPCPLLSKWGVRNGHAERENFTEFLGCSCWAQILCRWLRMTTWLRRNRVITCASNV